MKHMDRLAAAPTQSFSRALSSCAGPNHGDESQAGILCSGSLGDISKRQWQVPDLASDSAGQRSTEVMRCASTVSAQLLRLRRGGGGEWGREGKQGGASNPVVQIPSIKKKSMTVSNNHPLALTISSTLIHFFFLIFNLSCACLCTQFSLLVRTERHQNIGFVQSVFLLTPDTSLPVDITLLLKIEL